MRTLAAAEHCSNSLGWFENLHAKTNKVTEDARKAALEAEVKANQARQETAEVAKNFERNVTQAISEQQRMQNAEYEAARQRHEETMSRLANLDQEIDKEREQQAQERAEEIARLEAELRNGK